MKNRYIIRLSVILACLLALPAWPQTPGSSAQAPVVRKIEPPNWWTHFTPELQLLLTGEGLTGASVESQTMGLEGLGAEASANGHYLFVRL